METYLPYPSLDDSVRTYERFVLARVRRSIPRILDIIHEVEGITQPPYHPEIERWRGHEPFLCEYGFVVDRVFKEEVSKLTRPIVSEYYSDRLSYHLECATAGEYTMVAPPWWGRVDIHIADQSALLRLDFDHYNNFFEGVSLTIPPFWMHKNG